MWYSDRKEATTMPMYAPREEINKSKKTRKPIPRDKLVNALFVLRDVDKGVAAMAKAKKGDVVLQSRTGELSKEGIAKFLKEYAPATPSAVAYQTRLARENEQIAKLLKWDGKREKPKADEKADKAK